MGPKEIKLIPGSIYGYLTVIKLIFTSPPTHFKNEKIIHTFFKEKKHSGEWFRLNTDDILLVKNFFKSENQPSL